MRTLLYFRYNKRSKGQEKMMLVQGLDLPTPPAAATQPLPPNRQLFSEAERHTRPEHTYALPDDTAGQARNQRRRTQDVRHFLGGVPTPSVAVEVELETTPPEAAQPVAAAAQPVATSAQQPVATSAQPVATSAQPVATQPAYPVAISGLATDIRPGTPGVNFPDVIVTRPTVLTAPASTTYRHHKRDALGLVPVNKRLRARNHCSTCHRPKTKDTGHSCLHGYVFCPENVEGLTLEQWRAGATERKKK